MTKPKRSVAIAEADARHEAAKARAEAEGWHLPSGIHACVLRSIMSSDEYED